MRGAEQAELFSAESDKADFFVRRNVFKTRAISSITEVPEPLSFAPGEKGTLS